MTEPATDAQVIELEEMYAVTQQRTASLRRTQSILSLVLGLTVIGALFMIYSRGADMYTQEKIEPALKAEFEILAPEIGIEARALMEEVAPVYRDAASERIQTVMPELREAAETELFGLTERLQETAERQVGESLARLESRHIARLQEHFPELENDSKREDLKLRFIEDMEVETVELLGGFHQRIIMDLQNVGSTIEGFRPNRFEDMERNALLRTYMHKWLMLADYEVMAADDMPEKSDG